MAALAVSALSGTTHGSQLRPESELNHGCYDFPSTNFQRTNRVNGGKESFKRISVGDPAVDFTLPDVNGNPVQLSALLQQKPVLLVWGMWTDPKFQRTANSEASSFKDEWDLVEAYKESVTVVHLVGPEPNPLVPDTSFETGTVAMDLWSTLRQTRDTEARNSAALKVAEYVHPAARVVADPVSGETGGAFNQGLWCTMGRTARGAVLIRQDGVVEYTQEVFGAGTMGTAIDSLLASAGDMK